MFSLSRIYAALMLLSLNFILSAQNTNPDTGAASVHELIVLVQETHGVRIFCKPEWLSKSPGLNEISTMTLTETIEKILRLNNLKAFYLDGYIILTPSSGEPTARAEAGQADIVVGDRSEYGRWSSATFSGKITDGQTGEVLPGAVIGSEMTGVGTATDSEGKFSITLAVGEHILKISYVGFESTTRKIDLLGPGSHDFELFEESLKMDEVTVMARRAEANITSTRMSMITMDARTIRELPGSFGERDILKSMTLIPGIQSVGEFGTGFHVRGGSADQNLLLIEDVPIFNSSHLFGLTSVINPDMITGLTLMKAGIPAKYGERSSSVTDIRIRPENLSETVLSGGIGLLSSRAHLQSPLISDNLLISGGVRSSYSNWLLGRMPDDDLMNSSAGFYDLAGAVSFRLNAKNTFSAFGYHSTDNFSVAGNTNYQYGNTLSSLRWNAIPGEKLSFSISGGISRYNYRIDEDGISNPFEAYTLHSSIDYLSLKSNFMYFPNTVHHIEFGFNIISYHINPGHLAPLNSQSEITGRSVDDENAIETALYISDNYTINDDISIEAGLRYSDYRLIGPATVYFYNEGQPKTNAAISEVLHFGRNEKIAGYNGLEPRLSIRYSLEKASSLKASYNRNNQYINLISNTSVITPADVWKLSDTHLRPLTSDQISLGYFRNFRANSIETSVEIYYKYLNNVIEYKEGARIIMNDAIETDLVNAIGHNYGIELYAKKNSGRLTGWAGYTFSRSLRRSRELFDGDQINNNEYFPSNYDKPHDFVINSSYNLSRRWVLGGTFTYSTGRPVTLPDLYFYHGNIRLVRFSERNRYRLPDYHRLDISVTLNENLRADKRGKGSWTVSLINVYGRKNAYSVFYEKAGPRTGRQNEPFSLYKLYIIGRPLPTLNYNFRF